MNRRMLPHLRNIFVDDQGELKPTAAWRRQVHTSAKSPTAFWKLTLLRCVLYEDVRKKRHGFVGCKKASVTNLLSRAKKGNRLKARVFISQMWKIKNAIEAYKNSKEIANNAKQELTDTMTLLSNKQQCVTTDNTLSKADWQCVSASIDKFMDPFVVANNKSDIIALKANDISQKANHLSTWAIVVSIIAALISLGSFILSCLRYCS